jgi:hypothetical protein
LSKPPDLRDQARDFAARISALLNGTITDGVRVSAVLLPEGAVVGYNVTSSDPFHLECVPVGLSGKPRCYVAVNHTLTLDEERVWLMDAKSFCGLYLDPEPARPVVRYDYERAPNNAYPPAHMQIEADSAHLRELCARFGFERELSRLHFPVGGKRFRPTLEDLVEFLVVEGFAEGREGWQDVLQDHRRRYYLNQLRAAIRRDQEEAAAQLKNEGWTVTPPS